jgi:hypothetical protein
MSTSPHEPPVPDIELPPRTRCGDAPGIPVPFLARRLLDAHGPFGLDVEIKSRERVVGSWTIEVSSRLAGELRASQAKANLYVCASIRGDVRATGAFLVLRQWWMRSSDKEQLEFLYEALSGAALERLDSLLGGVPNASGESRLCVLFLVDGRHLDRKIFSLDRLQIRLLEDLESEHAIVGVDLRIAHGRGRGTQPHVVFASTLPAPLQGADSGLGPGTDGAAGAPPASRSLIGEVFVRETLSPANARWNRRASDRLR